MRSLLTVVLLAFAWQVTPVECLASPGNSETAAHALKVVADATTSVFVLSASGEASFLPIADSAGSPHTGFPTFSGTVLEDSARSFLAGSAGVISGLSPPQA